MVEKISCIVPAYNEGNRIGRVMKVICSCKFIDEVIAINDGSTDNTLKELKKFKKIKVITYKKNRGKSYALMKGLIKSKNELVMLIDSDLLNLTSKDLFNLIEPIKKGKADVSISLRKNSLLIYKLLGIDFISGERVFKKSLLGDLEKIAGLSGFAFESYLNKIIISKKQSIKIVNWNKVISPRKSVKFGFFKGFIGDLKMTLEIIHLLGFFGMIATIFKMRKLVI